MPVRRTTSDEKPVYQWGKEYTYKADNEKSSLAAKKKAIQQRLTVSYHTGTKPEL